MSRTQRNWGWLSGAVAIAVAIVGLIAWAARTEANSLTKDEAERKYVPRNEFQELQSDVKESKGDIKILLQRTAPRNHREVAP